MKVVDEVKIQKDRIGALVGPKGSVKREIEKLTDTKLDINSETGIVKIERQVKDAPGSSLNAKEIVKAVGLGFSPKNALKLISDDYYIEQINLEDHVPHTQIERVKSRIIGREGKAREMISHMAGADIVIYKNNVNILGQSENVDTATQAVMMLIDGAMHKTVFKYLEKSRLG